MSRSVRHHPFCGITTSVSEAWWKAVCSRALRVVIRGRLAHTDPDELLLPTAQEARSKWGPKDGKQRFNAVRFPELMRK
jgi:hypothetical protein